MKKYFIIFGLILCSSLSGYAGITSNRDNTKVPTNTFNTYKSEVAISTTATGAIDTALQNWDIYVSSLNRRGQQILYVTNGVPTLTLVTSPTARNYGELSSYPYTESGEKLKITFDFPQGLTELSLSSFTLRDIKVETTSGWGTWYIRLKNSNGVYYTDKNDSSQIYTAQADGGQVASFAIGLSSTIIFSNTDYLVVELWMTLEVAGGWNLYTQWGNGFGSSGGTQFVFNGAGYGSYSIANNAMKLNGKRDTDFALISATNSFQINYADPTYATKSSLNDNIQAITLNAITGQQILYARDYYYFVSSPTGNNFLSAGQISGTVFLSFICPTGLTSINLSSFTLRNINVTTSNAEPMYIRLKNNSVYYTAEGDSTHSTVSYMSPILSTFEISLSSTLVISPTDQLIIDVCTNNSNGQQYYAQWGSSFNTVMTFNGAGYGSYSIANNAMKLNGKRDTDFALISATNSFQINYADPTYATKLSVNAIAESTGTLITLSSASATYINKLDQFAGDVTGPYSATVVGNDSHTHGNTSITGEIGIAHGGTNASSFNSNKFIYYDGSKLADSPYYNTDFATPASVGNSSATVRAYADATFPTKTDVASSTNTLVSKSSATATYFNKLDTLTQSNLPVWYSSDTISFMFSSTSSTGGYNQQTDLRCVPYDFSPTNWCTESDSAMSFTVVIATANFANTPAYGNTIAGATAMSSPNAVNVIASSGTWTDGVSTIPAGKRIKCTITQTGGTASYTYVRISGLKPQK